MCCVLSKKNLQKRRARENCMRNTLGILLCHEENLQQTNQPRTDLQPLVFQPCVLSFLHHCAVVKVSTKHRYVISVAPRVATNGPLAHAAQQNMIVQRVKLLPLPPEEQLIQCCSPHHAHATFSQQCNNAIILQHSKLHQHDFAIAHCSEATQATQQVAYASALVPALS